MMILGHDALIREDAAAITDTAKTLAREYNFINQ